MIIPGCILFKRQRQARGWKFPSAVAGTTDAPRRRNRLPPWETVTQPPSSSCTAERHRAHERRGPFQRRGFYGRDICRGRCVCPRRGGRKTLYAPAGRRRVHRNRYRRRRRCGKFRQKTPRGDKEDLRARPSKATAKLGPFYGIVSTSKSSWGTILGDGMQCQSESNVKQPATDGKKES